MTCPFCGSEAREDSIYDCGSGSSSSERSIVCRVRETRRLRIRIADIDDEAAEWKHYAEALERIGDEMKHAARTCHVVKWEARRARRPQP